MTIQKPPYPEILVDAFTLCTAVTTLSSFSRTKRVLPTNGPRLS